MGVVLHTREGFMSPEGKGFKGRGAFLFRIRAEAC